MALFFGRRRAGQPEQRATLAQLPRHVQEAILGIPSGNYSDIDLSRAENSLQSVAVHAAVDLLASLASELPLDALRGRGLSREEIPMSRHPWLEDPAGDGQGLEDWIYQAMVSWLLRGNLFGDTLETGPGGILRQVALFHPDDVRAQIVDGEALWFVQGREVPQSRMLHRRVNPVPGQVLGLSPIAYHMWTIGLSLASTRFGMQWFQDGAQPSGILSNTETVLDRDQALQVKDRFMESLRGRRDPVVLGRGWQWQALTVNPEESQFLETQGFSAAECARMFGPGIAEILGYSTGGSTLTYSNLVDRDLHVLKYAADKWLRRMERLLSMFLPRPQYVRFNRDALLETNTASRYQAYAVALGNRWQTVNEVRELEDMQPVPWGDLPNGVPGTAPDQPDGSGSAPADEGEQQE